MTTHRRDEQPGGEWSQPNDVFTHREDWARWCPYCLAEEDE